MQVGKGRTFIGSFAHGKDLLESLHAFLKENNIRFGYFNIIGAVKKAKLGYYKQDEKKYIDCVNLEKTLEISTCMGNVSIMNDKVFAHAHVVFSDHQGNCYGGHLMPGSVIFACEYVIQEFLGEPLSRVKDHRTGLMLWSEKHFRDKR